MRKFLAGLLTALVLVAAAVQPAWAASSAQARSFGFQCADGLCRLRLDLGVAADTFAPQGVWLEVMEDALRQAPGGVGLILDDAITISLPSGRLLLEDAELFALVDAHGAITNLHGSALLPLPTFGVFGDLMLVTPTRVTFGYDLGAQLDELNAPLDPARRYAYFKTDAGLHVLTAKDASATVTPLPGQRLTVVADLAQPMLWFDGEVTVRMDGQVAFLRELVEPVEGTGWLPDALPLRQTMTWAVQGQMGQGIEPQLLVDATVQMDAGLVGTWLALEDVPLVAHGHAMISPAGLLVTGSASTDVSPTRFFGADALAEVFVPFSPASEMRAALAANVQVPFLGIDQQAAGRIAGEPQQVIALTQDAWLGVQAGAAGAGHAAKSSWDWAAMQGQDGYLFLIEQAGRGWALARSQWCGLAPGCPAASPVAERVAAGAR